MTSVQTAPGLPPSLPTHRSRFLVSASSLRLPPTPPSSTPTPSSTGSDQAYTSRRKRFSPISVTHTTILGREQPTHIVSLGTIDLAAVLRHATSTRTPPELARPRTPEPEEPEPITKDTRERPRYRPPTSPVRPTKPLPSTSRPAPISIVRPRAQFPLYLPILDSRVPPIVLPSLESLDAAAQAQVTLPPAAEGRRSGRARRPASRTLEYTSDPVPPPVRKRRADVSEKQTRTSKRPRKDVNYVIPSLASIEREIAGEDARVRRRRRSETSASLSDKEDSSQEARKA